MGDYYGVQGGSGAAQTYNQHPIAGHYEGPTSYPTGGFVVDLTPTYSSVNSFEFVRKTVGGTLPVAHYEYAYNTPSAGQVTVKVMRHRYDRVSSIGSVQNQPAGVTVQATSGVASTSESTHTHSTTHDHGSFATGIAIAAGSSVLLGALGPNNVHDHTHQADLPSLAGTSGAGTAHNHTDNTIYQHGHSATYTATVPVSVELAAATNLSTTEWWFMATGVKL